MKTFQAGQSVWVWCLVALDTPGGAAFEWSLATYVDFNPNQDRCHTVFKHQLRSFKDDQIMSEEDYAAQRLAV